MNISDYIVSIPDFPKPGVVFRDITPVFLSPECFRYCVDWYANVLKDNSVNKVVAIESRGFLFASAVCYKMGIPLALIRKRNKLPRAKVSVISELEYGEEVLEIHTDAVNRDDVVAIIDDVLATGGTVKAASQLVENLGAKVTVAVFLIELRYLEGNLKLKDLRCEALVRFD
ncbi:MAG: adenine phosphoribosyltransferase [Deltaproteobacteria bacterium]|nr:adenine phosphoribosyltransferase [Deltaproteobacteria bacterium]